MAHIPNDPVVLLSFINTKLRDHYDSLDALCEDLELDKDTLCGKLSAINYTYQADRNQFV